MRKIAIALAVVFFGTAFQMRADEGMWLPMLIKRLDQRDLQKMGLQLSPEELYSVNHSSLKDAIVSLGGFCSGEMVSPEGLMLTNHHCGYDAIRTHSSVEHDYLSDGFWAKTRADELPNEGLFVSFLVRMEDVTDEVLDATAEITDLAARQQKMMEVYKKLEAEAVAGTHYTAEVNSFFSGNEFYLFVYETFTDVRLVGAPPSSIGKFGGDTDNWMWPRQTGDFSVFRVYSGPDGKPAEYSPNNIPLKPKHFLPVSIAGVKEGDFTMTAGYPGSTDRYLTSFGVRQALDLKNPAIVEIRDKKLAVLDDAMDKSTEERIMYASKYAQIANYWKYFIGQSEQLKQNKVANTKVELEEKFEKWANANPERKAKYGNTMELFKKAYALTDSTVIGGTYVVEAGLLGADAILFSYRVSKQLEQLMAAEDSEKKAQIKEAIKAEVDEFFESHRIETDKKLFAVTHELYYQNVPADQQPEYLQEMGGKYKGKWSKMADKIYDKSIFADKSELMNFIENPDEDDLKKDPLYRVSHDLFNVYRGQAQQNAEARAMMAEANRQFLAGLREMNPDKTYYPDANSTMRFSFGQVHDYEPRDGVVYKYYTTLEGVMAKEDPSNDEFVVPEKLKELYKNKNYGRYADEDGTMHVNFISGNDITGGNSGSPVINGAGELVGIAFDGNWEAMSGDISYENKLQRTISVDIRYVLFVMDKFAGAKHLVDEMTLVSTRTVDENKKETSANAETQQTNKPNSKSDKSEKPEKQLEEAN